MPTGRVPRSTEEEHGVPKMRTKTWASITRWNVANIHPRNRSRSTSVRHVRENEMEANPVPERPFFSYLSSFSSCLRSKMPHFLSFRKLAFWEIWKKTSPQLERKRETDGARGTSAWIYFRDARAGGGVSGSGTRLVHTLQRRACVWGFQQISDFQCMRSYLSAISIFNSLLPSVLIHIHFVCFPVKLPMIGDALGFPLRSWVGIDQF